MYQRLLTPIVVGALALAAAASQAQVFGDQTLAVVFLDGSVSINPAGGVPVQIANYAKTGSQSAPITTATLSMYLGSTATSEGFLQLDGANPQNLYVAGYTTFAGTGSINATTGAANPRMVAQYNWQTGIATYTTLGSNDFSGGSPRSAVYVNNTLYASGASSGTGAEGRVLAGTPGTAFGGTQDLTPVTGFTATIRVTHVQAGSIFASASANIYSNPGGVQTSIFAATPTLTSIYDFRFADPNTLYITDDSAATGGIYVATRTGGTGTFGAPVRVGTSTTALRGLAYDGTTLFATSATGSTLLSIDPTTGAQTTLATAQTGQVFRGVEVVPEPASMAALGLGLIGLATRRRRK